MDAEWCVGYLNILIGQTEIKHFQVIICHNFWKKLIKPKNRDYLNTYSLSQEFLAAGYSREIFGVLF